MKCKATIKRFWNGVMVGPGTGNETVDFDGDRDELDELGFTEITPEVQAADDALAAAKRAEQDAMSQGLTLEEYTNPPRDLPVSGGTSDELASKIRGGSEPERTDRKTTKAHQLAETIKGGKSSQGKGKGKKVAGKGTGKKGSKVGRATQTNESADQSKVSKGEDGKATTPVDGVADTAVES